MHGMEMSRLLCPREVVVEAAELGGSKAALKVATLAPWSSKSLELGFDPINFPPEEWSRGRERSFECLRSVLCVEGFFPKIHALKPVAQDDDIKK